MSNVRFFQYSPGALAILLLSLAGCTDDPFPPSAPGPGPGPEPSETYYKDIKPVVDMKCSGCHQAGGIGPFPLTTYEEVSSQKDLALWSMESRSMPPWPPAQDCADFQHNRSLSEEEIALFGRWVKAGAPAGDPATAAPPVEPPTAALPRVDHTLVMKEAYTPKVSPDDYRCFVLDWPASTTKFVTGMNLVPGNRSMIHHMIAFLAKPDQVAEYQGLDDADAEPGYECFGSPGGSNFLGWIGAWVPGSMKTRMPEGTGMEVPAGSKIIMQLHYNTLTTPPVADQTSLEIMVEDAVDKPAFIIPFTNPNWLGGDAMSIPANSEDVVHAFKQNPAFFFNFITNGAIAGDKPVTIHGAGLHMHTRGTQATLELIRADGQNECLLDIPKWDFHWQGMYDHTQPMVWSPGDTLALECHYNNTTSSDMSWGEGTLDEMCLGTLLVSQ